MKKFDMNILKKLGIVSGIIVLLCIAIITLRELKINNEKIKTNEKTIVKIWAIHGDIKNILTSVTDEYTRENPNVIFEITGFKNEVYKTALRQALITNEAPDMFFSWGDEFLKQYVNLGLVKDITNLCSENDVYSKLNEGTLEAFTVDEKVYGIPIFGWDLVMYANKDMFYNNNIKIPENYNEFIDAINKFNEINITPITIGAKEPWTLSLFYMMLALKNVELDGVKQAVADNSQFDQSGFLEAAQEFKMLCDINAFNKDSFDMESYNSDYNFRSKNAAMTLSGTWLIPLLAERFQTKEFNQNSIETIPLSSLIGKNEGVGGYSDSFVINNNSKNKEVLLDIYLDIIKKISDIYTMQLSAGLPVWKEQKINEQEEPILYDIVNKLPNTKWHRSYDQVLPNRIAKVHLDSIEKLYHNEITPEEFIKNHIKN